MPKGEVIDKPNPSPLSKIGLQACRLTSTSSQLTYTVSLNEIQNISRHRTDSRNCWKSIRLRI